MSAAAPVAVGTVFAKNYLSFARVLADSVRRHHPDVPFIGLLADEAGGWFDPRAEAFEVVEFGDLSIPGLDRLPLRYSHFELSVVGKGYLLEHLLNEGYEVALFLDADIQALGDLGPLLERTREAPITLLPHLLAPLEGGDGAARELTILQSGVYNGGVVAVRESDTARRFLEWWQDRVYWDCRYSLGEGLHYDQRWLDFVPTFFPEAQVFRDPRFNIAHWNLPERFAELDDWRLFHFSGYEPSRPQQVTRYSGRVQMSGALRPLYSRYQGALEAAGWKETSTWPFGFAATLQRA